MRSLALLGVAAFATVLGCSTSASPDDEGGQSADQVSTASSITFKATGFAVETSGKLTAGSKTTIAYDLDRLPQCRGNVGGGGPAWNITGFASFNGQPATTFDVSKLTPNGNDRVAAPYELKLPEGGDLAIWFQVTNRWGCSEYDSQYSQNFHFKVDGPPPEADAELTFNADGSVDQSAPLKAGSTVAVRYEQDRLTKCRASRNGYAAWSITGHARVNGGTDQQFSTARPVDQYGEKRELIANIVHLDEAGELELWFNNSAIECTAWDSKDGQNYRFPITQ